MNTPDRRLSQDPHKERAIVISLVKVFFRRGLLGTLPALVLVLAVAAPAAQAAAPSVTTGGAGEVHFNRTHVNGEVNPSGTELEACTFEYGETATYGESVPCKETPAEIGAGGSAVKVSAEVTGLEPNTRYHFRLSAKSEGATVSGDDEAFVTLSPRSSRCGSCRSPNLWLRGRSPISGCWWKTSAVM